MNRSKTTSKDRTARPAKGAGARLAEERARQERQRQHRRRGLAIALPLTVVLIVVAALAVVKVVGGSTTSPASHPVSGSLVQKVTSVPPVVLNEVGAGTVRVGPQSVNEPPLTADGRPKVLYIGAEYCPYCAGERWAMVVALSRFGTFTALGQTASSTRVGEPYPGTATLSFHGSHYASSTISFSGVETESNHWTGNTYAPLDTPKASDQQIFSTYDFPPYVSEDDQGSIPFVDIGGKYCIHGAP